MSNEFRMNAFVYFRMHKNNPWENGLYVKYEGNQYKGHIVRNAAGTRFVIRDEKHIKLAEIVNA